MKLAGVVIMGLMVGCAKGYLVLNAETVVVLCFFSFIAFLEYSVSDKVAGRFDDRKLLLIQEREGHQKGVLGLLTSKKEALKVFTGHAASAVPGYVSYVALVQKSLAQNATSGIVERVNAFAQDANARTAVLSNESLASRHTEVVRQLTTKLDAQFAPKVSA